MTPVQMMISSRSCHSRWTVLERRRSRGKPLPRPFVDDPLRHCRVRRSRGRRPTATAQSRNVAVIDARAEQMSDESVPAETKRCEPSALCRRQLVCGCCSTKGALSSVHRLDASRPSLDSDEVKTQSSGQDTWVYCMANSHPGLAGLPVDLPCSRIGTLFASVIHACA